MTYTCICSSIVFMCRQKADAQEAAQSAQAQLASLSSREEQLLQKQQALEEHLRQHDADSASQQQRLSEVPVQCKDLSCLHKFSHFQICSKLS